MPHTHQFIRFADFLHAPIGEPPAHTHIIVLTCTCGVWDVFPPQNYTLCTGMFRTKLQVFMRSLDFVRLDILDNARAVAALGGGHECHEWRSPAGSCLLCDRPLPSAERA